MSWFAAAAMVLGVIVFVVVLITGVLMTVVGLPGTAVILIDAIVYSAATGWEKIPPWMLLVLAVIAAVAEFGDNILTAAGVKKYGGSTAGMVWAVIGSLIGATLGGLAFGLVLPFAGSLLGPIIGGLIGGFYAAYWYEKKRGRSTEKAAEAGKGALIGRIGAAMLKSILASIMVICILVYAF